MNGRMISMMISFVFCLSISSASLEIFQFTGKKAKYLKSVSLGLTILT